MRGKPALCGVFCVIVVQFCRPWKTATIDSSRSGWLSIECQRSERGPRPITASVFLASQDKEAFDRVPLVLEQNNALFAASADPTPTADERSAAEEIRLDRHCIVARHVLGRVNSLDIQAEPVLGHARAGCI